jgi:hypothetical protein
MYGELRLELAAQKEFFREMAPAQLIASLPWASQVAMVGSGARIFSLHFEHASSFWIGSRRNWKICKKIMIATVRDPDLLRVGNQFTHDMNIKRLGINPLVKRCGINPAL